MRSGHASRISATCGTCRADAASDARKGIGSPGVRALVAMGLLAEAGRPSLLATGLDVPDKRLDANRATARLVLLGEYPEVLELSSARSFKGRTLRFDQKVELEGIVQQARSLTDPGEIEAAYAEFRRAFERVVASHIDGLPPLGEFVPGPDIVEALEAGLRVTPAEGPTPALSLPDPPVEDDLHETEE